MLGKKGRWGSPRASGSWGCGGSEKHLQLLPTRVQVKGPHQPAERGAMLHALQQLLQPLPGLAYTLTALSQALGWQLCNGAGRGDNTIELTEAVPRLPDPLLELGWETLEAGGEGAVSHVELLDESTRPGQSPQV